MVYCTLGDVSRKPPRFRGLENVYGPPESLLGGMDLHSHIVITNHI